MKNATLGECRVTSVASETAVVEMKIVQPQRHPLVELSVNKFGSFDEWLKVWNSPEPALQYAMVRFGLLYSLQTEATFWRQGEREKVVMFLLTIADGFTYGRNFMEPDEQGYQDRNMQEFHAMTPYELRQEIATRAYNILCLKFFRSKSSNEEGRHSSSKEPFWAWVLKIEHIQLIRKIFWFFRVKVGNFGEHIENISRTQHVEIVQLFLSEFAKVCIQLLEYDPDEGWGHVFSVADDLQMKLFLLSLRPQCVSFLNQTAGLNWLLKSDLELFEPENILEKLRQLALGREYYLPSGDCEISGMDESRKPVDLDEAVLGGSVAARILILYRIQMNKASKLKKRYNRSVEIRNQQLRRQEIAEVEGEALKLGEKLKQLQRA